MSLTAIFDRHPELEFHGVTVLRGGHRLLERTWAPYRSDDLVLVYSASKTFTAAAVGLAVSEGHFALSDMVVDLLAEDVPTGLDPRNAKITVHHLLSMSTGHDVDTAEAFFDAPEAEWVTRALAVPVAGDVGSRHVYNNGATFLLGELVRRYTGADVLEYLQPRLLEPLGLTATWDRDALGRCFGWSGMHLTTAGLAAMGELYRRDGMWNGQRLLPEGWVAQATTAQIPTDHDQPEWRLGYGYQLWLNREGFRLDGAYGQYAIVLPRRELVVAITSSQETNQRMLDFVFEELLPALPEQAEVLPDGEVARPSDTAVVASWAAAEAVPDAELGVEPEAAQINLPLLTDLTALRGPSRCRLRFTTEGSTVELSGDVDAWTRQQLRIAGVEVPVAFSFGTQTDGSLLALLAFTDTPHTLRLRLAGDGTAGLAWKTSPLRSAVLSALSAA